MYCIFKSPIILGLMQFFVTCSAMENLVLLPKVMRTSKVAMSSLDICDGKLNLAMSQSDPIKHFAYSELLKTQQSKGLHLIIAMLTTKANGTYQFSVYEATAINSFLFGPDYKYNRYTRAQKTFLDPHTTLPIVSPIAYYIIFPNRQKAKFLGTDYDFYRGEKEHFVCGGNLNIDEYIKSQKVFFNLFLRCQTGSAESLIAMAELHGCREDFKRAQYYYYLAAKQDHPQACLELGKLLYENEKLSGAEHWLGNAVHFGEDQALYTLGFLYYNAYKIYQGAKYYLLLALKKENEAALQAKKMLIQIYLKEYNWAQAEHYLNEVAQIQEDSVEVEALNALRGTLARRHENYAAAQDFLRPLLDSMDPIHQLTALYNLCMIPQDQLRDDSKQHRLFIQGRFYNGELLAFRSSPQAWKLMNKAFMKKQKYHEVIKYNQDLLTALPAPAVSMAHLQLGIAYYKLSNTAASEKHLSHAISDHPANVHYYLGKLQKQKNTQMAMYHYTQAALKYNKFSAKITMARLLVQANQKSEAKVLLQRAEEQSYFPKQKAKVEKLRSLFS